MNEQRVLSQLLYEIPVLKVAGSTDVLVSSIEFDSRKVSPGALFVATVGTAADGHQFIDAALQAGAVAIVCERFPAALQPGVCYVSVEKSTRVLGHLAAAWYDFPSSKLALVGVTGTNGKTTIATLLYQLFSRLGHKAGLLSTVVNYIAGEAVEATHTTPDALTLNALLARMVEAGCSYAFMEVSSHAVEQGRIAGLEFDGGIFTNLTRDHLDYHLTFENYLKAKKGFFDALPSSAFALTNTDDKNGMVMLQNTAARKYTYSMRTLADFHTRILEHGFEGMLLSMNDKEVNVSFIGRFNAANLTAVYGAALLLGADELEVLRIVSSLGSVSGRFETLRAPSGYTAIVDYAHTPDALANVITTINQILQGSGRLITVVGCGGNRDKGKRPLMACEAVEGSWKAVFTSDNPRFEDPAEILNDMLAGLDPVQKNKSLTIVDRREAIKTACALAQPGDVVLVAGKGHEDYQIIQGVKYHFDDREELKTYFTY
ncbi:MAG: UDP-N-acetylmuramoyl-L-alanyl-D-glutamate--2,6-diaminopimelate ligase [Bacteroidales bacterium]|nr:UDP-N-acetylmuramoyl-L-alanyl-D-glutamate--2,6-diaminopimelate ligase [Bacteroidales bacterium]